MANIEKKICRGNNVNIMQLRSSKKRGLCDIEFVDGLKRFRKPIQPKHALFHEDRRDYDEVIVDIKTGKKMILAMQPMHLPGAGKTRGVGLKVLERIEANTIFAISEEPLVKMDSSTYSVKDYTKNGWIVKGDYASKRTMIPMFVNAIAPINVAEAEIPNCQLRFRQLPKGTLRNTNLPGMYSYVRSTRVIPANSWAIVPKYGDGPHCLTWGQDNTIKRQQRNMAKFQKNKDLLQEMKQFGNDVCFGCGNFLPRDKKGKKAHFVRCPRLKDN